MKGIILKKKDSVIVEMVDCNVEVNDAPAGGAIFEYEDGYTIGLMDCNTWISDEDENDVCWMFCIMV